MVRSIFIRVARVRSAKSPRKARRSTAISTSSSISSTRAGWRRSMARPMGFLPISGFRPRHRWRRSNRHATASRRRAPSCAEAVGAPFPGVALFSCRDRPSVSVHTAIRRSMSVDFTKLRSFVKIVDAGSVSRAASILRTAQPALSQQVAALESHFKHKLLTRSNTGITPTEAGLVLYRHAQLLLKQIEQAKIDIDNSSKSLAGRGSTGLATHSPSRALSLPILKEMKALHPQIIVHINDSFGHVLSELIMTGKMDMAVIYGSAPIKGGPVRPLFREELFLLSPPGTVFDKPSTESLPLSALADMPLLLPSRGHFLRRLIDESLARARVAPKVVSEIESVSSLAPGRARRPLL